MIFSCSHQELPEDIIKKFASAILLVCYEVIFSHHVVNSWNSLPQHIIEACSLNDFKSELDMYWTNNMYFFSIMIWCTGYLF